MSETKTIVREPEIVFLPCAPYKKIIGDLTTGRWDECTVNKYRVQIFHEDLAQFGTQTVRVRPHDFVAVSPVLEPTGRTFGEEEFWQMVLDGKLGTFQELIG